MPKTKERKVYDKARNFFLATKNYEESVIESRNHKSNVMKELKEFRSKNPTLKGEALLIAFRDSGSKYAECWNDDKPFQFA